MRSCWSTVVSELGVTGVLIKRCTDTQREGEMLGEDRDTLSGKSHVTMEGEIGVKQLQAKEW